MKAILKLAATTLVLLCAFTLGNTQSPTVTVFGNAYNSETGDPITDGHVYCQQNPSISTTTGPQGDYILSIPLNSSVCCSKKNFRTATSDNFTSTGRHSWDPEMIPDSSMK